MKNSDLISRSLSAVWHPCTQMKRVEALIPFSKGKGIWLYDFEGKRYLDAISSWWVNLFGHCNPRINSAITDQLEKLEHVILAGCTHEPAVELSERLSGLTGLGHAFYASDGASSVEIALKMSFHYWKNNGKPEKRHFISLENGYHGETLGALSVTDIPVFSETYSPLIAKGFRVSTPDWRRAGRGESPQDCALRAIGNLEKMLEEHGETVAALIVEPLVQGAAGMGMHHPVYLSEARRLCEAYSVHLIADEIAVGFGRTGSLFACEQGGITPDFLCLSKGITGGYLPLSVVLTKDEIFQAFYDDSVSKAFLHSHSYTGNALACRAALAVLDIFDEESVIEKNAGKAAIMNEKAGILARHPKVSNFRNIGMIWAFEVNDAGPDFSAAFHKKALEKGLLLRPVGNTVYFMPPYVIEEHEMDLLINGTLQLL